MLEGLLIVIGLCVFETISSIDNAVINAEVLGTMSQRGRKWFLLWGLFFAVFAVRGLLPWLIVWGAVPGLGPIQAFLAAFSSDPKVAKAVEEAAPFLLIGGGTFLILLFLNWIFLEEKEFGLPGERFLASQGIWFHAIALLFVTTIVWISNGLGKSALVGATAFFFVSGFKKNAEEGERKLKKGGALSDFSKILFLEVIDATFSIDGVVGAFAFTLSVPLILIGNGLGALVVRQLTVGNIERIKKYRFLKNGAMYSIAVLGTVMIAEAFGAHVPSWISPIATFAIIGFFFWKSK